MQFNTSKELLEKCPACAGSGIFDTENSPPRGSCYGTGKINLNEQIETYARYQYIKGYEESMAKLKEDIQSIYQETSPSGAKLAKIREYLKIEPQEN
jgi:hypothetical protein